LDDPLVFDFGVLRFFFRVIRVFRGSQSVFDPCSIRGLKLNLDSVRRLEFQRDGGGLLRFLLFLFFV
jgi:hypothetical protein